jgi:pectin methylesterase-like acyl-CoA thioesterase
LRFDRLALLVLLGGTGTAGCAGDSGGENAMGGAKASGGSIASGGANANGGSIASGGANATGGSDVAGGSNATGGSIASGGVNANGGSNIAGGGNATGGSIASGGTSASGGSNATGGSSASGGTSGRAGTGGAAGTTGGAAGGAGSAGASATGGATGTGGATTDPSAPLTPVAFFPSKQRTNACADASVSIQFNRTPTIKAGGKIQILDASGAVFDSVTANPQNNLYFADLVSRSSGGQSFKSEVLDVVFNTVVFHPKSKLEYGKTYHITVDQGMITDSAGNSFSVKGDEWSFTVRAKQPDASNAYTLAADGSGDFCSLEGVLQALPDSAAAARVVTVKQGVYPGIVRMSDSNVKFVGAGIDQSVFAHKNCATMNSSSREGIVLSGNDITFENLTIFNTYLQDGSGQQAEALFVKPTSQRVFLNNVHLRSHQDTLRVDGPSVYMKGGKISGSTDPLWGYGGFYCDGCELASRTSGHAFIVARSTKGFAVSNCKVTKESSSVKGSYLAQVHDGAEPGKIAYVNCEIDTHVVGWRSPVNSAWYEYGNTDLSGKPITFNGTQLKAGSAELTAAGSAQSWLGWSP